MTVCEEMQKLRDYLNKKEIVWKDVPDDYECDGQISIWEWMKEKETQSMTREERENAINFLKGYLDEEVYTEKCRNAHKMAIKVLEQEPCDDCISRQAAQAKIKNICNEYRLSYEDGERKAATGGSAYALGHAFDDLPPVTPQSKTGHWKFIQRGKFIDICCSECGYVSVKDYAYNYTIDQLDEQEKKDFFAESHMNFCECCGSKMLEIPTGSEKE